MLSSLFFLLTLNIIFCRKYPIYDNIGKSKKGKIKTIDVASAESYMEYLKNNDNVISYFHSDFCDECEHFLPILDEASRYKIINKKWVFLKIDCARNSHICMNIGVDQYPTSEVYVNKEVVNVELPDDLTPLLELLYKLSTEPVIKIKSKEDFFKKYGYYSPIVEIENLTRFETKEEKEEKAEQAEKEKKEKKEKKKKKSDDEDDDDDEDEDDINDNSITNEYDQPNEEKENENEDDFLACITRIAKQDFIQTFYFGVTETKDYKEKIVFDNENYPITYLWDGICQNAIDFLNANKYPLLNKVDKYLLKELDDEPRILFTLITFPENTQINYFIYSMYKKLSFDNRKYIFGYVDYNEDPDLFENYTKVELNSTNEMQLIINNFEDRSRYVHPYKFDLKNQTEKEIFNEIKILIDNVTNLNFETGSRVQDFINFIGINKMDTTRQIIFIIVLILICIGCVYFCGSPEDLDDEFYEYEEVDESGKEKNT